ncbi:hypothetical protein [Streptococcus fryi]
MSLQEKEHLDTMFANLSLKDKSEIDAMSLLDITNLKISVLLPRKGLELGYALADKEEKARIDYLYYRFEQLMAKEPIDWRDPQFMEKLNAHINEKGLNPFTGQAATESEKLVAKHYGWVKSSSTMATSVIGAFIDFSELTSSGSRAATPLYTADDVSSVLNRRGYTVDDFLRLTDADSVLSPQQTAIVRDIRLQVGLPENGTRMAKIIPSSYVEGIVKHGSQYNTVSGFVSIDSHSSSLKTLYEVFEGNRLDYHNTPYHPGLDETYAKINFDLDHKARLDIPLSDPKVDEYPFTGRGFTGSENIVLPEFKIHKNVEYQYQTGDTITVYNSQSGEVVQKYGYTQQNGWIELKP